MSTRVHIVLPEDLLKRVDRARGDIPRSKFVQRSVEKMVERLEAPTSNPSGALGSTKVKSSLAQTWAR